jgi:hypothetical protein
MPRGVVDEHFHCDGPEQEQTDRQVGGTYHWAVELEQGPHGLLLALTVPVVFSFKDSGVPPDPQVVQPVPQIENGEALIMPTKSDIDVFVSQKMSNQIWNLEYIDLALSRSRLIGRLGVIIIGLLNLNRDPMVFRLL